MQKYIKKRDGTRKAIDEYVKVLDIKNDDYETYFKISKLLNDLGKIDESIEMLKILSKNKPTLYEANKMLGELLSKKENFKEAINAYVLAIKYSPEDANLYYGLGLDYSMLNEFSLAKECFLKSVEINSNLYNAYYRLGQIALLYRDINEAEKFFTQSIYGDVEKKSFYQLGKIYMMKNNKIKAKNFLEKSIENSSYFYKKACEEPIFFPIKDQIEKPKADLEYKESDEEKRISDYLDNTYALTKILNEKENKKRNNKKFSI